MGTKRATQLVDRRRHVNSSKTLKGTKEEFSFSGCFAFQDVLHEQSFEEPFATAALCLLAGCRERGLALAQWAVEALRAEVEANGCRRSQDKPRPQLQKLGHLRLVHPLLFALGQAATRQRLEADQKQQQELQDLQRPSSRGLT